MHIAEIRARKDCRALRHFLIGENSDCEKWSSPEQHRAAVSRQIQMQFKANRNDFRMVQVL